MKIISIIAQKGGATKTTLAIHLAVEAVRAGKEAIIFDLDPQASSAKWKDLRTSETPVVVAIPASRLEQSLKQAQEAGAELVIIDTAPHSDNTAMNACRVSDLILIPTKTGILDLQTVPDSLSIAQLAKKPACIILSAISPRGTTAIEARKALEPLGVEVSPYTTVHRAVYSHSLNTGQTATEAEPKGKASQEIKELYNWIMSKLAN